MKYLKENLKIYINSFKNKKILLVLILNISFILVTAALIQLAKIISKPWVNKIEQVNLSNIAFQTQAELETTLSSLRSFAAFAITLTIILILLIIINWSIFQGMIYSILLKKKLKLKYLAKFSLLNIIWFIPWLILGFIIINGAKINYLAKLFSLLALSFLHLSFVLYTLFTKHNKLHHKKHIHIGILKIHHFVIPYTLISFTFLIISQLRLLNPHLIIIALIYLLFFSWLQNYTKDVVLNIQRFK